MRTLVIDTATKACSVALYDGDALIASHHEVIGRGHAERLLPLIANLPDKGRANKIMVDVGPGSFTGIRVGVAAARALGFAWSTEVGGYSCLQLVAAMARQAIGSTIAVDVVMTGGHGEYFHQHFSEDGLAIGLVRSLPAEQVDRAIQATYVAGDIPMSKHLDILPNAAQWHLIADIPSLPAKPVYGRAPDAKPISGGTP